MGLYVPTSVTPIKAKRKGMVGDLGVWTPREDHQLGARDNLSGPLPFAKHGKSVRRRGG